MEIRINNQLIDITLENEKTLAEVMGGISAWLGPKGHQIVKVALNGKETAFERPEELEGLTEISVDTIKTLDITALTPGEQKFQYLNTLYQYFTLLLGALKAGNGKLINELRDEFPYVEKSVDKILGAKEGAYADKLREIIASLSEQHHPDDLDQETVSYLENLIILIRTYIQETTAPMEELKGCSEKIEKIGSQISEVSILLQTGKDRQAMDSVLLFIGLSEKITRLVDNLSSQGLDLSVPKLEGESFAEFMRTFNAALNEVVTGFNNNDSVLIGDVLEYEVAPLLERFSSFIVIIDQEHQKIIEQVEKQ